MLDSEVGHTSMFSGVSFSYNAQTFILNSFKYLSVCARHVIESSSCILITQEVDE